LLHKRIKTYTVVPLSPEVGVMEWVSNTIPVGSFLLDKGKGKGAHSRYHPHEWTHTQCRSAMKAAKESTDKMTASATALRSAFSEACSNFTPVFRYFFLEFFASGTGRRGGGGKGGGGSGGSGKASSMFRGSFGSGGGGGLAEEWYERRLTYASSLAVSSMVGHIMGIGDRHTHNILIDTRTAEVGSF
jgi:ataxia telangiectasia mutated family protein